jgi:hypothetical protein
MKKYATEFKWAGLFTAMQLVWMLGERVVGLHSTHIDKHMIYTNFIAIPAIGMYVLALLDKRKRDYGGRMTYAQGVVCGLVVSIGVAAIAPLAQVLISTVIAPAYFPNMIRYAVAQGQMQQAEAEAYFSLRSYMMQATVGALAMGAITSVVVAAFTRRS